MHKDELYYECGKGWLPLIKEAIKIIKKYNKKQKDEHFAGSLLEIIDIKEKWGGLDISLNYYVPEISQKMNEIRVKSFDICEQCGTNKNVSREWTHGWIMTLCKDCREKEIERYDKLFK